MGGRGGGAGLSGAPSPGAVGLKPAPQVSWDKDGAAGPLLCELLRGGGGRGGPRSLRAGKEQACTREAASQICLRGAEGHWGFSSEKWGLGGVCRLQE